MSDERWIEPVYTPGERLRQLQAELEAARQELLEVEAALGEEQAAINAFRMHCRLLLGNLIEELLGLRAEKESLLTQLQLLEQDIEDAAQAYAEQLEDEDVVHDLVDDLSFVYEETADRQAEKRLYRELARRFHPDLAATNVERAYATTLMTAVNKAYAAHDVQTLRDLAGELDPEVVAKLDIVDNRELRKLRKNLLNCRRRQRKVAQQLKALRQETISRLWRRAQALEAEGLSWWEEVRLELQTEIKTTQDAIATLQIRLQTLATLTVDT